MVLERVALTQTYVPSASPRLRVKLRPQSLTSVGPQTAHSAAPTIFQILANPPGIIARFLVRFSIDIWEADRPTGSKPRLLATDQWQLTTDQISITIIPPSDVLEVL